MTRPSPQTLRVVVWVLALAPALWFATFWSFVFRARLTLARWPVPYDPDPKDLGFDVHYLAVAAGLPLSFAASAIVLLFAVLDRRERRASLLAAAAAIAAQLAISATASLSSAQVFFAWFAD
jgi:hypothetical protein